MLSVDSFWYYADDKLAGTATYGDDKIWGERGSLAHHPRAKHWSKPFDWADEILVCSGDGSKWLVVRRLDITGTQINHAKHGLTRRVHVQRSSERSTPHDIHVIKRMKISTNSKTHPFLTLTNRCRSLLKSLASGLQFSTNGTLTITTALDLFMVEELFRFYFYF